MKFNLNEFEFPIDNDLEFLALKDVQKCLPHQNAFELKSGEILYLKKEEYEFIAAILLCFICQCECCEKELIEICNPDIAIVPPNFIRGINENI